MLKKHIIAYVLISILLTSCAQLEVLLSGAPPVQESPNTAVPSATLTPSEPTATVPTATPTISPTPTISLTPRPTHTPRPALTPSVTIPPIIRIGPDNFPDYVNPLTGLTPINPLLLDRRPMAVKIPLFPLSTLPRQSGISLADHVWEYYLEYDLTRFVAIFYGNDALRVGPIRSGRIFDEHIIRMYNAFFVTNGYHKITDDFYKMVGLDEDYFILYREGITPLYRDTSLSEPNNVFLNTFDVGTYAANLEIDNSRPDLANNYFYSLGGAGKPTGTRIYINYSYASYSYWDYDPTTQRYYRYQGIAEQVGGQEEVYLQLSDSLTDQPIVAENVVVLFVPHEFYTETDGGEIFDIRLLRQGEAYVFRNGKAEEAQWLRSDMDKPLQILTTTGERFPLKPGVTFFQVINTASEVIQDDTVWTFNFIRPDE